MRPLLARAVIPLVLVSAALSVTACNTVSGAGKDVESTGKAVTDVAEEAKEDLK